MDFKLKFKIRNKKERKSIDKTCFFYEVINTNKLYKTIFDVRFYNTKLLFVLYAIRFWMNRPTYRCSSHFLQGYNYTLPLK